MGDRWKSTDPQKVTEDIIRENSGESPIHLYKFEDSYFIAEGMHRSVLAKFLGLETMRCKVTRFSLDNINKT
ncbi:MAG: ParB N-terminal domain-containing protein [Prevotella sp.]|nr:ParB N-terminal domain-containing protein [Prevotella sp.]